MSVFLRAADPPGASPQALLHRCGDGSLDAHLSRGSDHGGELFEG